MKPIILKIQVIVILAALFHLTARSQSENIVSKLKAYTETHVTEKAYLHFDKPYYAAGDTIYFKAYLTLGEKNKPSKLSGVLHVDLINTSNKVDRSVKLQVVDGVAWGDFTLSDTLPKGNYRVRAYTQWMRNEGDTGFFDQTITVGSAVHDKIPESGAYRAAAANAKPDLQFFPEGGQLLLGVLSKVAFKAIGADGLGVAVKGVIIDNTGNEVTSFTTTHLGMGYFYLKPETGNTYKAKVSYGTGMEDIADLPQPVSKGITLKIDNDSLSAARVQIIANESYFAENHDKPVNLLVYSGGIATMVALRLDSAIVNLAILKRHLHTGITKITLFSAEGEPLGERLIFIQNPDQLKLSVNTDKTAYSKRDRVQLKIHAVNRVDSAVAGHFSVSVIDETKGPVNENPECTILNYLLLTSELKGYIEQPNYYFTNINGNTRSDLDLVMLTHGYRSFEWKQLLGNAYPPIAFQPESALEITGMAKNALGRPLVNGTVSLISPHEGPFLSEKTDNKGVFRFSNLLFTDSTQFMLQAVNSRGKNSTTLTYNKDIAGPDVAAKIYQPNEDVNQQMAPYLENSREQLIDFSNYSIVKGKMLKEVKINERKSGDDFKKHGLAGPGYADQVMNRKEIGQIGGQLATSLNGRLRGINFINPQGADGGIPYLRGIGSTGPMQIVVDGAELPLGTGVNTLNSNYIETVEVLKYGSAAIYGMGGGNGVLVITTRQGGLDPGDISAVGILPIKARGFYKAREFYSPKYEHPNDNINRKDLRSTIYWNPELTTDADGNTSFEFYNADGKGSYRVVVEGIDNKGNLGRQVYRYKIE